jgi:hypothetical protein
MFLSDDGYTDEGYVFQTVGGGLFRGAKGHLPPWKELSEGLSGKCFVRAPYNRGLTIIHPEFESGIVNMCGLAFYNAIRSDAPNWMIHLRCEFGHNLLNSMVDLHEPDSLEKLKNMIGEHGRLAFMEMDR